MSPRRWRSLALVVLAGVLLSLLPAAAHADDDGVLELPAAGPPLFGPGLDWSDDSAAAYRDRLGLTPSLYEQRVEYPVTERSGAFLEGFVRQLAPQGAVAVLSLEPSVPLRDLDPSHAEALAERLGALHDELGTTFLVRFAPEMNGTWYAWGQQPGAFVDAFRTVADVLHTSTPEAQTVWSPVYGAGYPYGAAYGDVDPDRASASDALDTDGNGRLDGRDDPYGPYWPGPDAVDWVGLTLYHFGIDRGRQDNDLDPVQGGARGEEERSIGFDSDVEPEAGAFRARLEEEFGYGRGRGRSPFYERFAERHDLPLLVETGAVWLPDPAGDPELDIKRTWWRQVLESLDDYPLLRGIAWLEQRRPEAEVDGRTVDWRATRSTDLARALAADLEGTVVLGPITDVPEQTTDPTPADETSDPDRAAAVEPLPTARGLVIASWCLLALLLVALATRRLRPGWSWSAARGSADDPGGRDERLDALRGGLLVVLVLAHLEVLSGGRGPVAHLMGVTTGPEAFVLLSGAAIAVGHAPLVARVGEVAAGARLWRRAAVLWFAAVATTLLVLGLSYVPGLRTAAVTTWTTPAGERIDLFADAAPLLDYPPPWPSVQRLFALETGVWSLNILGLLALLSLVAPVVLWLLRRRLWWLVLGASWAAYAWGVLGSPDWTDAQFDAAYPPLVWQVVFVHGLVLGHHRAALARCWGSRWARAALALGVLALAVAATAAATHGTAASPWVDWWPGRDLPAGRLVSVLVVGLVALAVLTAWWVPFRATVGRALVPLGRAGLAVLVAHVLVLVAWSTLV
ncbi:OpgC protein [Nocardioides dokdonensis FR1436]|uniref:OpgC protein n=1 Tax=Nocardioides dokdonensis FR1436 TaxID=1300347 RepID=A0A1A9GQK2_9ACTN|nr:OpgC domain-containing protein [Nocardioides dokdonensis]ANH39922.1 OpgC protein [Nocardioides dokdonensis FR1436]